MKDGLFKHLCPIGHKDPEIKHYHTSYSGIFDHEEHVGGRQYASVRFSFDARKFPKKGVIVTDIIAITLGSMGTPMPNSFYKKNGIKTTSHPDKARKIGKRVTKLLLESRMQRKMK